MYRMQMKHIVEPLFVSHCILLQYCFLSLFLLFYVICPVHQVRAPLDSRTSMTTNFDVVVLNDDG